MKEKTLESLAAVLPVTGIVFFISIFFVPMDLGTVALFLVGSVMLILGMGFFQLGGVDKTTLVCTLPKSKADEMPATLREEEPCFTLAAWITRRPTALGA